MVFENRRDALKRIAAFESVIHHNTVEDIHITSEEMVELEEIEDLGAVWAFQAEPQTIVFVCGQDFYKTSRFPSTDFSIVQMHNDAGELVEMVIDNRGGRLQPVRTIPSTVWQPWRYPEHLEVIDGKLEYLDTLLKAPNKTIGQRP